jgi:hypothetical protein
MTEAADIAEPIELWRSDQSDQPWFGYKSYWTTSIAYAENYAFMHPFGGSALHRLEVAVAPGQLLDLRAPNGWSVLSSATGIDEADYDAGILGHEILQDSAKVIAAAGYLWVAHVAFGVDRHEPRPSTPDEWMYLGTDSLPATFVRSVDVQP